MSYTLRGRIQSRLAAAVLPLLAACVLALVERSWWPLELVGVMVVVGVALDAGVYHRLLAYQPGWAALPLGLLELTLTFAAARALDVAAPLEPALALFAGAWLVAQVLAHAGLPLARLTYAEDGGELGRAGSALVGLAPATIVVALGVAWATEPPTVRLAAGVHEGPIVLDRSQKLVGEDGAVVVGGIVVTADDVLVENVTVRGGEIGIAVDGAHRVRLEDVRVRGAELDGINVRRSDVKIRDCEISGLRSPYGQGIDISFGFDKAESLVERCRVRAPLEGIVSHFAHIRVRDNRVERTGLRAITITEMSMGVVERNLVAGARGVGIFCGDYSHCDIADNAVVGTTPDPTSDDATRAGYAIQAHFGAAARLEDNRLERNALDHGWFSGAVLLVRP